MEYRREIDGFRALAVFSVILNHVDKGILPSGYLGVDIFFVISGYVITASLYHRNAHGLRDFILDFYSRRIKRLLPALATFVTVTAVLVCLFDPTPRGQLKIGLASLFGLSNINLIWLETDYFAQSAQLNVFTHTWSLGVEEQFYLIFPLMIWFFGLGKNNPRRITSFSIALGALALLSLASFVLINNTKPTVSYYSMPTRFWELAAGCFAFLLVLRTAPAQPGKLATVFSFCTTFFTLAILIFPDRYFTVSTPAIVLSSVLMIVFTGQGTIGYKIFSFKPIVYVGLISYSLYLWHWGVLVLSRWTIGVQWWSVPLQLALMFALAAASYHYIEHPLRKASWSPNRWVTIGYGLAISMGAASVIVAILKPLDGLLYTGKRPDLVAEGISTLTDHYSVKGTDSFWRGEHCVLSGNDQVGKIITVNGCTLGDFETAKTRVLVIGNSYSAAFVQAFDRVVKEDGFSVTLTSAWGASQVRELKNYTPWSKANDYYWGKVVPELVGTLRAGDWVFMINDMAQLSPRESTAESASRLAVLSAGIEALSNELASRTIRLAVLHGNPFAREANCEPVTAIKQWFTPFGLRCNFFTREETLKRRENLDRVLMGLESRGKIKVVDLFDIFCPGDICGYEARNGQMLYRDANSHPSVEGAKLSAPAIRQILNPSWQAGLN